MFDIIYIILAFDNPSQIHKLVLALDGPSVYFYIHIDLKADQTPFQQILKDYKNVNFIDYKNRLNISWGDNSMVKSTLNLMNFVVKFNHTGYCVLLSNSDYPIKSNYEIREYFNKNFGNSFISMSELENHSYTYIQRLKYYKFELSKKRKDFVLIPCIWDKDFYCIESLISIIRILKKKFSINLFKILFKRKPPININPFWGSQWWALPTEVVKKVLIFCNENQKFIDYHNHTLIPDEIFFHSILNFLKINGIIDTYFDNRCTFMNFSENSSSPNILKECDYSEIKSLPNRFLFARKFDTEIDQNIINLIDIFRG